MVVVLTYRGEEVGLAHPLRRLLAATRGPHVAQLALAPLSEDAVAALAVGSGRDAAELFDATGGNPLFVTELIAAPPGRLPSSIKDAVVARLGQLAPGDAEVVRAISIVPDRVERTAVEVLCGPSDDSLAVAEHRGLLAGDASHMWFRHELVRQAVEDTLASSVTCTTGTTTRRVSSTTPRTAATSSCCSPPAPPRPTRRPPRVPTARPSGTSRRCCAMPRGSPSRCARTC